jgi:hypothetical protein
MPYKIGDPSALAMLYDIAVNVFTGASLGDRIAVGNPRRVAIYFVFNASFSVNILPRSDVSTTVGIPLSSGNSPLRFNFRQDGPLATCEWYCSGFAPGSVLTVIEVVYTGDGEVPQWPAAEAPQA